MTLMSPLLSGKGHLVTRHMEKAEVLSLSFVFLAQVFIGKAHSQASQVSQPY